MLSVFQESVITKRLSGFPDVMITATLYSLSDPVMLYSIQFTLASTAPGMQCALVWLDTNLVPVLTSNAFSRFA